MSLVGNRIDGDRTVCEGMFDPNTGGRIRCAELATHRVWRYAPGNMSTLYYTKPRWVDLGAYCGPCADWTAENWQRRGFEVRVSRADWRPE